MGLRVSVELTAALGSVLKAFSEVRAKSCFHLVSAGNSIRIFMMKRQISNIESSSDRELWYSRSSSFLSLVLWILEVLFRDQYGSSKRRIKGLATLHQKSYTSAIVVMPLNSSLSIYRVHEGKVMLPPTADSAPSALSSHQPTSTSTISTNPST